MRSLEIGSFHRSSKQELPPTQTALILGESYLEQSHPTERHDAAKVLLSYGLQAKSVQEALSFRGKKNRIYPLHVSSGRKQSAEVISRIHALTQAQGEESSKGQPLQSIPAFLDHQLHEKSVDEKTGKEITTPVFTEDTLRILFDSRTQSKLPKRQTVSPIPQKPYFDASVTRLATNIKHEQRVKKDIENRQMGEISSNKERFGIVADHFIDYAQDSPLSSKRKKELQTELRKLHAMFGLSEFSFETLVGYHGYLVIPEFLDNLQLSLNLNQTSNHRKALLALAAVTSEEELPAVHQLVSVIADYDAKLKRSNQKSKRDKKKDPLEDFFSSNKRRLEPEKRERIKKGRKQFTEEFAAELKNKRQTNTTDPKQMLEGLLAFHDVELPQNLDSYITQLAQKPIVELSHKEIAVVLSAQMERMTRAQNSGNIDTVDQLTIDLTTKLNDHGHFFFNMDFNEHHDKDTYHGVLITLPDGSVHFDLCLIHTPGIDLQLANMSFNLSVPSIPTFSVPAVGLTEAFGGIGALSQGVSLFAQAFAFGVASTGAVFSGGERKAGGQSGGSVARPKTAEAAREVSKPNVIFQSSGGGSRRERKATSSVQPKPKIQERPASTPLTRKTEKPKVTLVSPPSRSKPREVPIFTAIPSRKVRRETFSTAKPKQKERSTVIPKPTVEKIPRIAVQRRIINAFGTERKTSQRVATSHSRTEFNTSSSKTHQKSTEVRTTIASGSFAKRLEQVFQTKSRQRVISTPVEILQSTSGPAHSKTETKTAKQQEKTDTIPTGKSTEKKTRVNVRKQIVPQPITQKTMRVRQIQAKQIVSEKKQRVQVQEARARESEKEESTEVVGSVDVQQNANENIVSGMATLVGGAVIEVAKRVANTRNDIETPTEGATATMSETQYEEAEVVDAMLARKHAEYGQRHGGSPSAKKKTNTRSAVQNTDKVMTASMRSLPTNAMIDVSDSFNTAREVKMWAQEALAHPKLIERYYATTA
jgi:hypothetical protein